MTEQSYPADLQAILNELDRTDAEARELVSKLSEAQLNWHPGGGTGWSVVQCLDHLTQSTALYVPALQAAVRKAKAKVTSGHTRLPIQPPLVRSMVYSRVGTSAKKEAQGAKEGEARSATQRCRGAQGIPGRA